MGHCIIRVRTGQKMGDDKGTSCAELVKIYFCTVKFSTQVLISVWKIGSRDPLTSPSSTCCSCLHNFSAGLNSEADLAIPKLPVARDW